jgi:hypothetical protein
MLHPPLAVDVFAPDASTVGRDGRAMASNPGKTTTPLPPSISGVFIPTTLPDKGASAVLADARSGVPVSVPASTTELNRLGFEVPLGQAPRAFSIV